MNESMKSETKHRFNFSPRVILLKQLIWLIVLNLIHCVSVLGLSLAEFLIYIRKYRYAEDFCAVKNV
ncbi:hypothetical protein O3M35_009371 [Rhynocoris fuscipes]|uniref:Uncharacterized protein n=1 Tax=Rhynocoris fuscipes TaxID=488301 RepID=A0AAW1D2P0_9HEMI